MFTEAGQQLIERAKDFAFWRKNSSLTMDDVFAAVVSQVQARVLVTECLGLNSADVEALAPQLGIDIRTNKTTPPSDPVRQLLILAKDLESSVVHHGPAGLMDVRHIVGSAVMQTEFCAKLKAKPLVRGAVEKLLSGWHVRETQVQNVGLENLTTRMRQLRTTLLEKVFGQEHAIQSFVEGLFNAEVVASADTGRKSPRAIFVFVGPPGVGKTLLAESAAATLNRPFNRYDMSAYSNNLQAEMLIGLPRGYQGAHAGTLTGFVDKNPNAILLFDEIEKAHPYVINYFLQLLDAGVLEDKFEERNVRFTDTLIVFTSNAGRVLYEQSAQGGSRTRHAMFHRKTILDALEAELHPQTGKPIFPAAICSRLASGYPVLFNILRINEMERVVRNEFKRVATLFERQFLKSITFDDTIPRCIVLREGGKTDARTLRAQAESFIKGEIFKLCTLFENKRIEAALKPVKCIHLCLERDGAKANSELDRLFSPPERMTALLIAVPKITELYVKHLPGIAWHTAGSHDEALKVLATQRVDLVVLDLWIGVNVNDSALSVQGFDHMTLGRRHLREGQQVLQSLASRAPGTSVYLLSRTEASGVGEVDEELLFECQRAGGLRGILSTAFIDESSPGWEAARDQFKNALEESCRGLYWERLADELGREQKALFFDTSPKIEHGDVSIRLRNLRLARAVSAVDNAELIKEIERPATRFEDIIGADTAKKELEFFVEFMRDPRRFQAQGMKTARGVLLYGPPGTGKTMLARAMAGECNAAFIATNATSFVTMWQGSGPQAIRDMFGRARRYAPSIVFIDEIDAIGRKRMGLTGMAGHGEEMALNAILSEMDGFSGSSLERPVFVLAATNFSVSEEGDTGGRTGGVLDPALVRRFERSVLVDLPDTAGRQRFLNKRLGTALKATTVELLAELSAGMSIAELENALYAAFRTAAREQCALSDELVLRAFHEYREGDSKAMPPQFLAETASHEAGHAILYWASGYLPAEASIVAHGKYGGGVRLAEADLKRGSLTREDILAKIRTLLAGRAAELLCWGAVKGVNTGASSDLHRATQMARHAICVYGMDEEFGLIALPELADPSRAAGHPLIPAIERRVQAMLKEQMDLTVQILQTHRAQLDAVAQLLLKKNRVTRAELSEILPPLAPSATPG